MSENSPKANPPFRTLSTISGMIDSETPRKSIRNVFCKRSHKNKKNKDSSSTNPYSTRGLDKFSALLAELEEKRQKIYSQHGADDISFVRFVYKDSNDCVPVVVKLKNKKQDKTTGTSDHEHSEALDEITMQPSPDAEKEDKLQKPELKPKKRKLNWNKWLEPPYYLPVFVILILLFLVFFGRSWAILCAALGWYIIPTLKGSSRKSSKVKGSRMDRDSVRRFKQKKMVGHGFVSSPKSNVDLKRVKFESPRQTGYRKIW